MNELINIQYVKFIKYCFIKHSILKFLPITIAF